MLPIRQIVGLDCRCSDFVAMLAAGDGIGGDWVGARARHSACLGSSCCPSPRSLQTTTSTNVTSTMHGRRRRQSRLGGGRPARVADPPVGEGVLRVRMRGVSGMWVWLGIMLARAGIAACAVAVAAVPVVTRVCGAAAAAAAGGWCVVGGRVLAWALAASRPRRGRRCYQWSGGHPRRVRRARRARMPRSGWRPYLRVRTRLLQRLGRGRGRTEGTVSPLCAGRSRCRRAGNL